MSFALTFWCISCNTSSLPAQHRFLLIKRKSSIVLLRSLSRQVCKSQSTGKARAGEVCGKCEKRWKHRHFQGLVMDVFVYPNIHINICIKSKTSFIALYAQPDLSNQSHLGKEKLTVLDTLPVFKIKLCLLHVRRKKKRLRPNKKKISLNL